MNGAIDIQIEGAENLKQIFEQMHPTLKAQVVNRLFVRAAKPIKKAMISNLPGYLNKAKAIVKVRKGKNKEYPSLSVGFYRRVAEYTNSRGKRWDPLMLVYWHNYGTLANRDAGHKFIKPRKKISAKWRGGIMPGRFVDRAIEAGMPQAQKIIDDDFDKCVTDIIKKYAARL